MTPGLLPFGDQGSLAAAYTLLAEPGLARSRDGVLFAAPVPIDLLVVVWITSFTLTPVL
jgi:hypothetical protein